MAIWKREINIILIALVVWVADVAFLIYGECPLPITEAFLTSPVISQVQYR